MPARAWLEGTWPHPGSSPYLWSAPFSRIGASTGAASEEEEPDERSVWIDVVALCAGGGVRCAARARCGAGQQDPAQADLGHQRWRGLAGPGPDPGRRAPSCLPDFRPTRRRRPYGGWIGLDQLLG